MVPWWRGGSLVARFPGGEMTGYHRCLYGSLVKEFAEILMSPLFP